MNNNRNYSFDTLKCIMCFFVILTHLDFYGKNYINGIIDIAVPIFFMISGYFFYTNNIIKERSTIKKNLKNIFYLLLKSSLLYLLWRLFLIIISEYELNLKFLDITTCDNALGAHLWYLHAYIYMLLATLILSYFGFKLSSPKIIPFILIALHLFLGQSENTYYVKFILRVFCTAMAFWGYGIFCRKYLIPKSLYSSLIILGILLCICQNTIHFYTHHQGYSLGTIILALGIFPLFKDFTIKKSYISSIGMKHSMHIYIVHSIFIDILGFIEKKFPIIYQSV